MKEIIDLERFIDVLKKRWKVIVICTLTATLLSGIVTFFIIKPQYEASTKLFIGKEEVSGTVKNYDNNEIMMYQKLLKTYSEVIKTKDLAKRAIDNGNLDLKPAQVLSNLNIVPIADTQILQIKFKGENPKDAKNVIESVTNEFIEISNELVPNGNVQVLEEVQFPKNAVSPNKKNNILIGMLMGIICGCGLVILLEFLDNTFKSKNQIETELEIAVIGVIPNIEVGY
ncbi:MAG: YveK family protein [Clostridium sp.]